MAENQLSALAKSLFGGDSGTNSSPSSPTINATTTAGPVPTPPIDFASFEELVQHPLGLNCFHQYLSRIAPQTMPLLEFCIDADRCIRHKGDPGEVVHLHNIIKKYLLPGRPHYIFNENSLADDLDIEEESPNGAVMALHRSVMVLLATEHFEGFRQSPEFTQLTEKNEDFDSSSAKKGNVKPAAFPCVSFSLVKVNERGKRQNRTLSLGTHGVDSLRGDTLRFHYDPLDIHGIVLDPKDNTSFRLACYQYYQYECESEQHRMMVAEALESLGLGVVIPHRITARSSDERAQTHHAPSLKDFEVKTVIGRGGLAKVCKVKHKQGNRIYAMKIIKVPTLIQRKQVERVRQEKEILMALNHPFLVRLHYSFLDNNQLCMVLDFASGGDLFFHLRKARGGRLHHMPAGFYVAEMVCALEYLHNHDIIHRDLKPENILMGADGHLLLTDFGLSKADVSSDDGLDAADKRAQSMVGTKEYVAPEVVQRKPYGKAVDWWAVGILFYELIIGRTPFEQKAGHIFDHIVSEPIRFPESLPFPDEVKLLILGLLHRSPESRYGAAEIKSHDFFTVMMEMDWDALEQKDLPPPIYPTFPGGDDTVNFPDRFTKERVDSFVAQEPRLNPAEAAHFLYDKDPADESLDEVPGQQAKPASASSSPSD